MRLALLLGALLASSASALELRPTFRLHPGCDPSLCVTRETVNATGSTEQLRLYVSWCCAVGGVNWLTN